MSWDIAHKFSAEYSEGNSFCVPKGNRTRVAAVKQKRLVLALDVGALANRRDLAIEPGTIIAQTLQGGERVDCGTVIGVTISAEDPAF